MNVCLITDNEAMATGVRSILLREGLDCPASRVVTFSLAPEHLAKQPADLIVVTLPSDPVESLAALEMLKGLPERSRMYVMAIGPAADSRLVLRALRGAVDDYLDEADVPNEFASAMARWRESRPATEEVGKLISILAPCGGSGSSTLAANIATSLAKSHKSVALIDLKLETGDLAALLDLKPTHTLADLSRNVDRMDRTLFLNTMARHESGVCLLAPPRTINDVALVTADCIKKSIALARASFPYVIVDLDHSFRDEPAQVLRQSDEILVVFRLEFTALRNTRKTLDYLEHLGISSEKVRLVVNRYGQPKEVPASKAEEALGRPIFHYVPDDPRTVNRANNNGVPVVLESPSTRVSKSLNKLAVGVNGRLTTGH